MRSAIAAWSRGAVRLGMALALVLDLAGCEGVDASALGEAAREGREPEQAEPRNECLIHNIYIVEDDLFRYEGGGQQSHPLGRHGSSETGMVTRESIPPRATSKLYVNGSHGRVALYWEGAVVEEFEFDLAFFLSGEIEVLSYQVSDGTSAELHIYGRPDWQKPPKDVSTRAEIEALER